MYKSKIQGQPQLLFVPLHRKMVLSLYFINIHFYLISANNGLQLLTLGDHSWMVVQFGQEEQAAGCQKDREGVEEQVQRGVNLNEPSCSSQTFPLRESSQLRDQVLFSIRPKTVSQAILASPKDYKWKNHRNVK